MNLASIIDGHPDERVAFISAGRTTTYGELRAQVAAVRGALAGMGVGPGDRVAMLCANNRYFVISYLATLGLGAIAVPLNPTSPAAEITWEIAGVGARVAIVGPMAREAWAQVDRSRIPTVEQVIATEGHPFADVHTFEELLHGPSVPVVDVGEDDLAALLFTSGTVGAPRAAMLSHGNLLANLEQSQRNPNALHGDDVVFGVLPLFHIFGLNVVLGGSLRAGATLVLVQRFDPATALDTLRDRHVTVVPGAPQMYMAWAQCDTDDVRSAFARVRLALTGAAKMPEEQARLFQEKSGVLLREGYGLTEASPVVTSQVGVPPRLGSVGVPLPGVQVRLVDHDGSDVLAGDQGEIWVKGPNVFKGYWQDPEATARVLTADGWLRTGDVATVDDDGYLYIVDRVKDLIIVSGFNVFPAEVEEAIAEFPGVAEVAVVGVPHPHTGEAVKAYVVLEPGVEAEEDEIIDFCAERLARYKCPNKVLFVEALPRGTAGKVLRRILR